MPAAKAAVKAKAKKSLTKATHSPGTATAQREALEQRLHTMLDRVLGAFLVQTEVLAIAELRRRNALTAAFGIPDALLKSGFTAAVLENIWEHYTEDIIENYGSNITNVLPANLAAKASSKWVIDRVFRLFQRDISDLAFDTVTQIFQTAEAEGLPERMTARLLDDQLSYFTPEGEPSPFGWRVERLARTASTGIYNTAMIEQLREDGYDLKLWVSHHDDVVRDSHLHADGVAVPLDDPFQVGGSNLMYPGDTSGEIGQWINCRCVIVGEMGEAAPQIDWSLPIMSTSDRIAAGLPASPFLEKAVEIVEEALVSSGTMTFASNPTQARAPKGSPIGGRWIDTPSGLLRSVSRLRYGVDASPKQTEVLKGDLLEAERTRMANVILEREGRPSVEELAARMDTIYAATTPEMRAAGPVWYPEALAFAEKMSADHDITVEQAAAVIALTSPQMPWEVNKFLADGVASGKDNQTIFDEFNEAGRAGLLPTNVRVTRPELERARLALSHPDPIGRDNNDTGVFGEGANKTRTFAANIMGDQDGVTIDKHMYNILGQPTKSELKGGIKGINLDLRQDQIYEAQSQAVRVAAARAGMTPAEFQATLWVWDLTSNTPEYRALGLEKKATPVDASRVPKEATLDSMAASGSGLGMYEEPEDDEPIGYFLHMAEVLGFEPALTASGTATYRNPAQARAPQGTPIGGRWIDVAGGLLDRARAAGGGAFEDPATPSEEGMDEDWGDQGFPAAGKAVHTATPGLSADEYFGPAGPPRSLADYPVSDLVKDINPGYQPGDLNTPFPEKLQYVVNCQRCVFATELRARGYDAVANGAPLEAIPTTDVIMDKFNVGHTPIRGLRTRSQGLKSEEFRSRANLYTAMSEAPVGSRFIMFGRTPMAGHVWNAEMTPNGIVEVDAQTGTDPLTQSWDKLSFVRVDDMPLSPDLWDGDEHVGMPDRGTAWVQTSADYENENSQSIYQDFALAPQMPGLPPIDSLVDQGDRWLVIFAEPIWDDRATYIVKATREVVRELPGPETIVASGPDQARVGKGSEHGGEWIDTPGGLLRRADAIDAKGNKRAHGLNRQSVDDYFAKSPFAPAFAGLDAEYDRPALADLTRESLQEAVAEGVKVNVPMTALEGIAETGRFKTYAEIQFGNSKGTLYSGARGKYEEHIMGVPADRPYPERPVYGFGTENDYGPAQSYGDVTIHLKDSVKDRTTWTVSDSLDRQVRPLWTDEIDTASDDTLIASSHWAINDTPPLHMDEYWTDGPRDSGVDYVEAQVHGGVSWGDIDSIEVEDITSVSPGLAAQAGASGISLTEKGTGYSYDDYKADESYRD